jgi:copper(I)-binding protein
MHRLLLVLLLAVYPSLSHAADLVVSGAWIRYLPGDIPSAGYFTLENNGRTAVELTGAESAAFGKVMLHQTVEQNGVAKMVMVKALPIAPGAKLVFRPGRYHLMLMHAKQALSIGSKVPITLDFKDGTAVRAEFEVRTASSRS